MEIEKNIPIQTIDKTKLRKYPWPNMEINDSFLAPCTQNTVTKQQNVLCTSAGYYRKKHNPEFRITTRVEKNNDQEIIGVRAWRIA